MNILLVDDDIQSLQSTQRLLEWSGHRVTTAQDGAEALEKLRALPSVAAMLEDSVIQLVISDVRMPKLNGIEFLRALRDDRSSHISRLPIILMTAFGRVEDAVWAMKLGAVDFLTKPFKKQDLMNAVELASASTRSLHKTGQKTGHAAEYENSKIKIETTRFSQLLGASLVMCDLREKIKAVAQSQSTVLITGESGSGKELVAHSIHEWSERREKPWVALNCGALPESLIESELFGHEKGAFSGADHAKIGLIESAHQGTLFLDEIGDMPLLLQTRLLRVLQEGEIRRVGATQSRKVDVRIIAATHRDLHEQVKQGLFRGDLLFRLEVLNLKTPALRDHPEDLELLIQSVLKKIIDRDGRSFDIPSLSVEALEVLKVHPWPGNVRELQNVLERAFVFLSLKQTNPTISSKPTIEVEDLPSHLIALAKERGCYFLDLSVAQPPKFQHGRAGLNSVHIPFGTPLKEVEELLIRKTLEATDGDKGMTAKILGVNSRTIYRRLETRETKRNNGKIPHESET